MRHFAILFSITVCSAAELPFFIGTRTVRESQGIYRAKFDDATGAISELTLAAPYKNPGFLCKHPKKNLLYSVGNRPDDSGSLAVFSVAKDRSLRFLSDVVSGGQGPCHLAINEQATTIAVANYGSGNTTSFALAPKGDPSAVVSSLRVDGKSVHPQRQDAAHAHGVYFADGYCFVPDLGLDKILVMKVDAATSAMQLLDTHHVATAPGDGPRHLAFHPNQPWVYCVNELSNTVTQYVRNQQVLTPKKSLTTLPEGYKEVNTTAELEVHPNGRFLYASNRGHNSIASFVIDATTGELSATGQCVADVKIPRHFVIAPGGAYMIVAGQDSDNLHVLMIDPQTGKLTPTAHKLAVPAPTCLLFWNP
jgi:6-phosphogluconolactonase